MTKINLRGIAEGLVGASEIFVNDISDIYSKYPQLGDIQFKLVFDGSTLSGFAACDG